MSIRLGTEAALAAATAAEVARSNATYVSKGVGEVSVAEQALAGDVSSSEAWQRAVGLAVASGKRRIIAPDKAYSLHAAVNLAGLHGVTFEGIGPESMEITGTTAMGQAFLTTGACSDLLFRGLKWRGNVVDDATGPRRSRTTSGTSFVNAVLLSGNLDPTTGVAYEVRNIRGEDIEFQNISSLPFFMRGVAGEVELDGVYVENCLDTGFVFCDSVLVHRFRSRKSADNGISLSRGNRRVELTHFDIDGAAYHGVWIAGYEATGTTSDLGPARFVVGQGVVTNSGLNGIQVINAPKKGRVHDVVVDGCSRGPSDEPQDQAGVGIKIGGWPYNTPGSISEYAEDIDVSDVTLLNCARGGVHLRGVKRLTASRVTVIDPGSAFLADGTTAITSGDVTQNFGLAVDSGYASACSDVFADRVLTFDTRGTPLVNVGTYLTGSVRPRYTGCQAPQARTPQQYDGAASIDGQAGTTLRQRFMRDGTPVFDVALNTSNELEFVGRSTTDGSLLTTLLTLGRATGRILLGGGLAEVRQSIAAAASVTFNANSANHFSVVLSATAVTSSSITNPTTGQRITISAVQDPTGGRTFTWPTNCKFAAGAAPTDTTASKRNFVTFIYDGTNWNETSRAVAVG